MNHVLEHPATNTSRCIICGVAWRDLTSRDIRMLTTEGKCIGQTERWRPCHFDENNPGQPGPYNGRLCLGVLPGHEGCTS